MKKWIHGTLLLSLLGLALYGAVNFHSHVHEGCESEWSFSGAREVPNHFTRVR